MQRELARLAIDHCQKDHGEALLHLGVLVELVEDDLRFRAALKADDDAHSVAVTLVAEVVFGNIGNYFFVDQLGNTLDQFGFVDLVGISVTMIACRRLSCSIAALARMRKRPRPVL